MWQEIFFCFYFLFRKWSSNYINSSWLKHLRWCLLCIDVVLLCITVIAVDSGIKAMELLQLNKQKSEPESPASNVSRKILFSYWALLISCNKIKERETLWLLHKAPIYNPLIFLGYLTLSSWMSASMVKEYFREIEHI